MFRKFLAASLIAATLPAAAFAAEGWTTGGVTVREGPGAGYKAIATAPKCAHVIRHAEDYGWVDVSWDGYRGWIPAEYLAASNGHCGY